MTRGWTIAARNEKAVVRYQSKQRVDTHERLWMGAGETTAEQSDSSVIDPVTVCRFSRRLSNVRVIALEGTTKDCRVSSSSFEGTGAHASDQLTTATTPFNRR